MKKAIENLFNILSNVIIMISSILLVGSLLDLYNYATIEGQSMEPTYYAGNHLVAIKFTKINRGDVVFAQKNNEQLIVKRVIGLPGETISYKQDQLYVNNKTVSEPYLSEFYSDFKNGKLSKNYNDDWKLYTSNMKYFTLDSNENDTFSVTLGKDEYWLMGDNRPLSNDSRRIGTYHRDEILQEVIFQF